MSLPFLRLAETPRVLLLTLASMLLVAMLPVAALGNAFQHPYGFEMDLPHGWFTIPGEDDQFLVFPSDSGEDEAILILAMPAEGLRSATDPETILNSEREVQAMYPMLRRIQEPAIIPTALGDALNLVFEGTMPGSPPIRLSLHVVVVGDMAISLMAVGARDQVGPRADDLDTMFASLRHSLQDPEPQLALPGEPRFAPSEPFPAAPAPHAAGELHDGTPLAREWAQRLAGRKLTVMSGYTSSGSSGGFNSRHDLTLFANGSFYLYGTSSVSISVDGLGGSSVSEEEETGIWRIASQGQLAVLELTTHHDERQGAELTRSGNEVFLNGTRVYVTTP
jgi:hypothetical protein